MKRNSFSGNCFRRGSQSGIRYITEDLLKKIIGSSNFESVTALNLVLTEGAGQIKYIENLDRFRRLQKLNLSKHCIEKIDHLSHLINLRELNLSNNCLTKIEGLEYLNNLQIVDLSYNQIKHVPSWFPEKLPMLKVFKIEENRLGDMTEFLPFRMLTNFVMLNVAGNIFTQMSHYRLYLLFYLRCLEKLDGDDVTHDHRLQAEQRFAQAEIDRLANLVNLKEMECSQLANSLKQSIENVESEGKIKKVLEEKNKEFEREVRDKDKILETTSNILKKKTKNILDVNLKHIELEHNLAFYKIDHKFDCLMNQLNQTTKDSSQEHSFDTSSTIGDYPYIGKALFKSNLVGLKKNSENHSHEVEGANQLNFSHAVLIPNENYFIDDAEHYKRALPNYCLDNSKFLFDDETGSRIDDLHKNLIQSQDSLSGEDDARESYISSHLSPPEDYKSREFFEIRNVSLHELENTESLESYQRHPSSNYLENDTVISDELLDKVQLLINETRMMIAYRDKSMPEKIQHLKIWMRVLLNQITMQEDKDTSCPQMPEAGTVFVDKNVEDYNKMAKDLKSAHKQIQNISHKLFENKSSFMIKLNEQQQIIEEQRSKLKKLNIGDQDIPVENEKQMTMDRSKKLEDYERPLNKNENVVSARHFEVLEPYGAINSNSYFPTNFKGFISKYSKPQNNKIFQKIVDDKLKRKSSPSKEFDSFNDGSPYSDIKSKENGHFNKETQFPTDASEDGKNIKEFEKPFFAQPYHQYFRTPTNCFHSIGNISDKDQKDELLTCKIQEPKPRFNGNQQSITYLPSHNFSNCVCAVPSGNFELFCNIPQHLHLGRYLNDIKEKCRTMMTMLKNRNNLPTVPCEGHTILENELKKLLKKLQLNRKNLESLDLAVEDQTLKVHHMEVMERLLLEKRNHIQEEITHFKNLKSNLENVEMSEGIINSNELFQVDFDLKTKQEELSRLNQICETKFLELENMNQLTIAAVEEYEKRRIEANQLINRDTSSYMEIQSKVKHLEGREYHLKQLLIKIEAVIKKKNVEFQKFDNIDKRSTMFCSNNDQGCTVVESDSEIICCQEKLYDILSLLSKQEDKHFELERKIADKHSALQDIEERIKRSGEEEKLLSNSINEKQILLVKIQTDLSSGEVVLNSIQSDLKNLLEEVIKKKNEIDILDEDISIKLAEFRQFEDKLEKGKKMICELKQRKSALESKSASLDNHISEKNEELRSLGEQIVNINLELSKVNVEKCNEENAFGAKKKEIEVYLKDFLETRQESTAKIEEAEKQLDYVVWKRSDVELRLMNDEKALDKIYEEFRRTEVNLSDMNVKKDAITIQLNQLQEELSDGHRELENVQSVMQDQSLRYQQLLQDHATIFAEIEFAEKKLCSLKKETKELENYLKNLKISEIEAAHSKSQFTEAIRNDVQKGNLMIELAEEKLRHKEITCSYEEERENFLCRLKCADEDILHLRMDFYNKTRKMVEIKLKLEEKLGNARMFAIQQMNKSNKLSHEVSLLRFQFSELWCQLEISKDVNAAISTAKSFLTKMRNDSTNGLQKNLYKKDLQKCVTSFDGREGIEDLHDGFVPIADTVDIRQ